jgi:hypothetical protein
MVWQAPLTSGWPPAVTSATPGTHGVGNGVHGCGVSTPCAALVALATAGLVTVVHIPNGGRLTMAAQSAIVATGLPSASTCVAGKTLSADGAWPKLQIAVAVETTNGAAMSPTLERPKVPRHGRSSSRGRHGACASRTSRLFDRLPDRGCGPTGPPWS